MITECTADIQGPQMGKFNVFGDVSPRATVNYTFLILHRKWQTLMGRLTWKLLNLFLVPREEPIYVLDTTLKPYGENANSLTINNSKRHTVINPKGKNW